ncbi:MULTISPECIES: methyltransferase domain-containing protein [Streptomyces]|uniref:Class I SAM-dependent methyltransferase n=1 Tax=Streptomyces lycii TaxID=2654337 RepID=A0ABQ7FS62_9ACTN|nr:MULTISPECIES: methyltransferase domain-containing protein [Streptomyces]KAF4410497.1 class I SAM-dependent methyltransferase [Streptomyces lycii]PGH49481.1 SAM-dependent methyltransferase [Streptomyces sp. Ru87]
MTAPGTAPWQDTPYADALRAGGGPLYLRRADGGLLPLDVRRWCSRPDAADLSVLRRCEGPVLDIGCGPGRLVAALVSRGTPALGIDLSPAAVARTTSAGGTALRRSVFDRLPGDGRWGTALLVDGNIGIGGDPAALLRRAGQIVAPVGMLLVETAAADVDERAWVRLEDGRGTAGPPFRWARLGRTALARTARGTGWSVEEEWTASGRDFTALRRRTGRRPGRR